MADKDPIKAEKVLKQTAEYTLYEFEDSEKKIKLTSKQVYKKKDVEIHFPWDFNGKPKYPNIKQFIYEGFEGKLPVGVYKVATFGYGFNSKLQPIGDYLSQELKIEIIKVKKNGNASINLSKKEAIITEEILRKWYDIFKVKIEQQKQDRELLAQVQLKLAFPKEVKDAVPKYLPNSIHEIVSTWDNSLDKFSDKDKVSIKEMFDKLSLTDGFLNSETLLETKSNIDKKYIEDVVAEFEDLMRLTADSEATEKKWQEFLNKHSWIFSYIFSFPVILFQDEAFVGGKSLSNRNGKITDFLIQNNLTQNVAFLEIKTHKTELIKKGRAYRGNDVYAMSVDLSGAVSQVLNQRDNFQKHYATLKMDTNEEFETFNSKCVVLMGQIGELDKKQLRPFELMRSNSKDVEIITFDELLERIKNIQKLITGEAKKSTTKKK